MLKKTGTRDPDVARAIKQHMRNWQLAEAPEPDPLAYDPRTVAHFVTISEDVGAGGGDVGELLGKALSWPVFDKKILNVMACEDEQQSRLYAAVDEREPGLYEETYQSFMPTEGPQSNYFHRLTDALFYIVRDGPAVLIGRGADLILPSSKGLRVRVVASLDHRIHRFVELNGLSFNQAAKQINNKSKDRNKFIGRYFNVTDDDPTRFDLLINVERLTFAQAVDTILSALKLRSIIP